MTEAEIAVWLNARIAEMLELEPQVMDPAKSFTSWGLDSTALLELTGDLSTWLEKEIPTSLVWEHPTIQALAAHLAASGDGDGELAMVPRDSSVPPPLTFSQERSWRQFEAHGPDVRQALKIGMVLKGAVDERLLDWCLTEIVRRHEVLRTNFRTSGEGPVQVIHEAPASVLDVEDCSSLPEPLAHARCRNEDLRKTVMNLSEDRLASFTLYRIGVDDYRLQIWLNHILADEVSKQVIKNELCSLYRWKSNGSDTPPPNLEIQVGDFAWWQRQTLDPEGSLFAKQLAWWKEYHRNAPPVVPAFTFRRAVPMAPDETCEGLVSATLAKRTYRALQNIAVRENATLTMALLTGFYFILEKYTGGQDGLLVGNYVSDRRRPKVYSLVGYFINLVVLKSPKVTGLSFEEALCEVRDTMQQVAANQDIPFEMLCEALSSQNYHPPYPSLMYQHIKVLPADHDLPGVTVSTWVEPVHGPQNYWGFTFKTAESGGELSVEVTFDTNLYELAGVQALVNDYVAYLEDHVALYTVSIAA